jgi:hypothetical protein
LKTIGDDLYRDHKPLSVAPVRRWRLREVLGYVQFDGEVLTAKIIRDSEMAVRAGRLMSRRPGG